MAAKIAINQHLFSHSPSMKVRSVELKADDSVQAHREKLARIILDDMYQFVALLDAEGTLLEVNRAALEGAGIRLEEIQGKPFWEARWWQVSQETSQRQQEVCGLAAQGHFIRYDVEIFGQSGGDATIIIDYSLIPVRDEQGKVVFLLAEGRNITEKKKADAEIARKNQEQQQLLERIKELDEIKSRFFANVSHELRTPLALILGPAERILGESDYLTASHRRDLQVIKRNAATLLKHVNDLLDVSKLDADKMALSYANVDLAQLVRASGGHFDALAPDRGVRFTIESPDMLRGEIDPDKIERVILNLLSNAFKFTPRGGRIRMALQRTADGRHGLISVQDSGPGVKPEDRDLIFQRFRQSDGGSNRQFGGTGLGLSIAKDFVSLHGGSISVTDAPGGGALFQVEIPLQAPQGWHVRRDDDVGQVPADMDAIVTGTLEELRPAETARDAAPVFAGARADRAVVLVVEDSPELNRFIVENLAGEFKVASAYDGEDGLQKAQQLRPDLIISDIMMPRMSGDEMIARLRLTAGLERIPVLILSAKADDELRLKLLANGAQDYVVKPFSAQELLTRSRNLVTSKRTEEQLALLAQKLEAESSRKGSQLSESEAKFRAITHAMPQMVWTTTADGYVEYVSPQWTEFAGLEPDALFGDKWSALVHGEDQDRVWAAWRHSLASGEPYEVEYRLRHRSGEYRWVLARALPVRSDTGETLRWMGTCTDIHEHKRNQQALQEADRRKDEFLAMLAHELRNPLAPLGAASNLLSVAQLSEDQVRKTSEIIGRQVRHMSSLLDDLLDVSRVTRGQVELDKAEHDMKNVVANAVEQVRPLIEAQGHHLTLDLAPEPAYILGDQKRLVQILANLLNNAVKYTAPEGRIDLRMGVSEGEIMLSVEDNGIGIDPELQPRVFDLFSQAQRKSDRSQGGLGIGLALVKSLVALHGGTVRCFSEGLGKGSMFTVTLPRHMRGPIAERRRGGDRDLRMTGERLRVLVVDDNVDAAQMLAMFLDALGHEVLVEHGSGRALERARRESPDVCLLDIGLPDMDGNELARRLRALPETAQAVLIAITGYGQAQDKQQSLSAGFDYHLVKPVDATRLVALMAALRKA